MELIFLWLACGLIGAVLGSMVKRTSAGFWLGLLLGPIGWIIVLLLPRPGESTTMSAPPSTAAPAMTAAARVDALTKLADLRERGVLTPEEFEAQKTALLTERPTAEFGVSAAVLGFIERGDRIGAIKQHRTETGLDLKAAKEAVEAAEARRRA
jgi:ribosomal protein L7/L12